MLDERIESCDLVVEGMSCASCAGRVERALLAAPEQPKHLFLAGLLVAFYVLSITWVAPRFGLGNAIMCVLLGQLISAAVIDQFGLMGAMVRVYCAGSW